MRGLLLFAAGAAFVLLAQMSPVPIGPPAVTCSLGDDRCPEVFWFYDIHWANDAPGIRSIEFRELPDRGWGRELPFEPEWAASIVRAFDFGPSQAAACYSNAGDVVCHYLEYGGDPEDLPWHVPTPRERGWAWCRDPENLEVLLDTAARLGIGQDPDPVIGGDLPAIHSEYLAWQAPLDAEFTENLDRACQAASGER